MEEELEKSEKEVFEQTGLFREPAFEVGVRKAALMGDVPMIPKKGRIIVKQNEFVQRGRVYIPDRAQVKPTTGMVVAIGPDVEDGFVRLGEMVVFSQYGGIPLNIVDGEGNETPFLSLTVDEIAGELIVDPSRLKK